MRRIMCSIVCTALFTQLLPARIRGGGGGGRVATGNRSASFSQRADMNGNFNANRNVNANVNRNVNTNVNRNVNANVNRGYYGYGYRGGGAVVHDNDWNWGSFAAGAATGAVTAAAVGAATEPSTVVVQAPPVGTVVGALPPGCMAVGGGNALYSCNNVYYQPFYEGTSVVYQVVPYP